MKVFFANADLFGSRTLLPNVYFTHTVHLNVNKYYLGIFVEGSVRNYKAGSLISW